MDDLTSTYLLYIGLIILIILLIIYIVVISNQKSESNLTNDNNFVTINNQKSELNLINDFESFTGQFPFPIYIINLDRKPERFKYVKDQLDNMGITNYHRVSAIDGFNTEREELIKFGLTYELTERRGIAGCAASHINMWNMIVKEKMGWTLILEDDAHFHPDFIKLFNKYWSHVPKDAKIVFPGFCTDSSTEQTSKIIIAKEVMCLQGYMISWEGARYLLDKLLPVSEPIDIAIVNNFRNNKGSYIFNGNVTINGIRPNDYKEANGNRCMFNGIIYQNHEEQGSTIHQQETIFR